MQNSMKGTPHGYRITWQIPGTGLEHVKLWDNRGRRRNREDLWLQVENQKLLVGGTEPEPAGYSHLSSIRKKNASLARHIRIESGKESRDFLRRTCHFSDYL